MSGQASVSSEDVHKELISAVVFKSVEESEDLLTGVNNADVKFRNGQTPLHVAVALGKLEWVEALLCTGADPLKANDDGSTALMVAEELRREDPRNLDRKKILLLVRLTSNSGGRKINGSDAVLDGNRSRAISAKSRRDAASSHRDQSDATSGRCGNDVEPTADGTDVTSGGEEGASVIRSQVSRLSREMSCFRATVDERFDALKSMLVDLSKKVDSLAKETAFVKDDTETLIDNASICGTSLCELRTEVASVKTDIGLKVDALSKESKVDNHSTMLQIKSMMGSLDQVRDGLASRDTLLMTLETSVTSMAEELLIPKKFTVVKTENVEADDATKSNHNTEGYDEDECDSSSEEVQDKDSTGSDDTVDHVLDSTDRYNCVKALTSWTQFYGGRRCYDWIRNYYEDIISEGPLTSSMLMFLKFQQKVRIMIDFESINVGDMKSTILDIDDICCSGYLLRAHAHFSPRIVYLGGKVDGTYKTAHIAGWLAVALARMSTFLAFRNKGRPYAKGDPEREMIYANIVDEAEEMMKVNGNCEYYIKNALSWTSQIGKEIALISAVPGIVAFHGHEEGTRILREQLPSLLDYYKEHVMQTFRWKTETTRSRGYLHRS